MADQADQQLKLVQLAREIAMEFRPLSEILADWKIPLADYKAIIETNPMFQRIIGAERAAWSSTLNTEMRVKLKAQAGVESLLSDLIRRAANTHENLDYATKAVALLAKLGGLQERPANQIGDPREKFNIVIKIGSDVKEFSKLVTPQGNDRPLTIDAEPVERSNFFRLPAPASIERE